MVRKGEGEYAPPDEVFGVATQLLVGWEMKMARPVDNLPVRIMGFLGAERRPSDQTLEHDGAQAPPVAAEVVALSAEDLWRNVVWGTDCGVCKLTTRLSPGIDELSIADGQLDLVEVDGIPIVTIRAMLAAG